MEASYLEQGPADSDPAPEAPRRPARRSAVEARLWRRRRRAFTVRNCSHPRRGAVRVHQRTDAGRGRPYRWCRAHHLEGDRCRDALRKCQPRPGCLHARWLALLGPANADHLDRGETHPRGPSSRMRPPWAGENQLPLLATTCRCYGRLGCGHDVPAAQGRLSPVQPDFDMLMLEVGGLDLDTIAAGPQRALDLPVVIPAIDGTDASRGVFRPAVAVMLKDWPTARNMLIRTDTPHEWLGIPRDIQILLTLFGSDRDLERLWHDRGQFTAALDMFPPTAVIVPGFSIWDGDLWLEHRFQMKRSWEFLRLLEGHGHYAIPHLSWDRRIDATDVADWLNFNAVDVVAFDGQCLGGTVPRWLSQLAWLRERLVRPPTLVAAGIRSARALRDLFEVWPDTRVVYNGLRTAGAHRELRTGPGGTLHRVRHPRPDSDDRPSLWAPGGDADPRPGSSISSPSAPWSEPCRPSLRPPSGRRSSQFNDRADTIRSSRRALVSSARGEGTARLA